VLSQTEFEVSADATGGTEGGPASNKNGAIEQKILNRIPAKRLGMVVVKSRLTLGVVTFFVSREEGRPKLIGTGDGLETVGRMALNALERNDLAAAQEWLDDVKSNALPESTLDEKGPALRYLWAGVAPETRNATFARAAAASLLGTYAGSTEAARSSEILQNIHRNTWTARIWNSRFAKPCKRAITGKN
jgi:hypothetical protein